MTEVALYSALYGGYEYVKPLPSDLGCRAILYTDEPGVQAPGWEVRVVTDHFPAAVFEQTRRRDRTVTLGMLRHKFWKCHPAIAVPDADITCWVDASMLITADQYAKRCVEALGDDDWCAVPHPYRDCVYTEAAFSATLPRYDWHAIARQTKYYQEVVGHPRHWGLFANGANVRRHSPAAIVAGEHWWYEITNRTHQDQLSLPVLFRLLGDRDGLRWNTRMPWGQWWGVYEHGRP